MLEYLESNAGYYLEILLRLAVAAVLGGIIGFERESSNRPAGFRTHILVCIGSALVMVTSEFIFSMYTGRTNLDPARLGAQVISGIGFLGAGTIIRDGINVRGLTTAASLWAVACVGIAAGIGFYTGAIAASALIYVTLILLKKVEYKFASHYKAIYVVSDGHIGMLGKIMDVFDKYAVKVKNMEHINVEDNKGEMVLKYIVKAGARVKCADLVKDLQGIEGIRKAYEE
jgi:putative Mg2+ transporter-C (MgtC) family protein